MYNGIGLRTPRGSGTNGYVQRNYAYVKEWRAPRFETQRDDFLRESPKIREANKEILLHEKKRKIEAELLRIRLQMEDEKKPQEEIEEFINNKRKEMLKQLEESENNKSKKKSRYELEEEKRREKQIFFGSQKRVGAMIQEAQQRKNERAMEALAIPKDFESGVAFDPELSRKKREQRRKQREEERKRREEERLERLGIKRIIEKHDPLRTRYDDDEEESKPQENVQKVKYGPEKRPTEDEEKESKKRRHDSDDESDDSDDSDKSSPRKRRQDSDEEDDDDDEPAKKKVKQDRSPNDEKEKSPSPRRRSPSPKRRSPSPRRKRSLSPGDRRSKRDRYDHYREIGRAHV